MAITGTFLADFSSFTAAVQQAEVTLKSFEGDANKVESSLSRMTNSFSGQKVIQEATLMAEVFQRAGGASTFTEKELARMGATGAAAVEKLKALGMDIPPGIQKIADAAVGASQQTSIFASSFARLTAAFTAASLIDRAVSSLIGWGQEAYAAATQVADLSSKTGLTTDTIQQMAFVAESTGSSVETFTQASFKLSAALAGGGTSIESAVKKLGLSFADLRGMSPDQQFNTIISALGNMTSEGERARLGMVLFGKSFSEMAAATAQGYEGLAAKATLMSKETIAAADRFDDRWVESKTFMKALLAETASFVYDARLPFIALAEAVGLLSPAIAKARGDIELSAPVYTDWTGKMAAVRKELEALSPAQITQINLAKTLGATTEELTGEFKISADALKLLPEYQREAGRAAEEHTKALDKQKAEVEKLNAAYNKLMSDVKNANQLAIMEDTAAAMKRQEENTRQLRLMEADAHQMQMAELDERVAAEATYEATRIAQNQAEIDAVLATGAAHAEGGNIARAAADNTVEGYAGVAQQITITGEAVKEWINLMKYTAQANAILAENGLFTSLSQKQRIAAIGNGGAMAIPGFESGGPVMRDGPIYAHAGEYVVPKGGGGRATVTNIFNIVDTEANIARRVSENITRSLMQAGAV
jgi:hypothetical protein